jgi:hypothetical protein
MIEKLEPAIIGVVCLHCGMNTPLPNPNSQGRSANVLSKPRSSVSLIRCTGCGKEAPYLAEEIVVLERTSDFVLHAA